MMSLEAGTGLGQFSTQFIYTGGTPCLAVMDFILIGNPLLLCNLKQFTFFFQKSVMIKQKKNQVNE